MDVANCIAAPSGSKARMFEAMDGRVRAGPLGARSTGQFRQHDVAETGMPGAVVFGYFLPKQKVTRSPLTKSVGTADLNAEGGPKGEPQGCGE